MIFYLFSKPGPFLNSLDTFNNSFANQVIVNCILFQALYTIIGFITMAFILKFFHL